MRTSAAAAAALIALTLGGCAHPVGPARTFSAYQGKARTTADKALSDVETAKLTAGAGADGKAIGPYVSRVLSDAEESLSGLAGTFGSVQPPDRKADDVRAELQQLLGDALDHVTALRVRARRGDLHGLTQDLPPLKADIEALQRFSEDHK